jgi:hypothetical protein
VTASVSIVGIADANLVRKVSHDRATDTLLTGLDRLTSGRGSTRIQVAPGEILVFAAHETAGRRQAYLRASRGGIACCSRLAATGKARQALTNLPLCVLDGCPQTELPIANDADPAHSHERAIP